VYYLGQACGLVAKVHGSTEPASIPGARTHLQQRQRQGAVSLKKECITWFEEHRKTKVDYFYRQVIVFVL
jgi:hypothetical protein